ncbi:hypothetical protein ACTQ5J_02075 [Fundicoccus sp. Sow4_F4]|uniref:hypothetical protein n=1 Tax=Fundicoccus sp. Sow4_F4 TaxID=3438783 RepID=UPI003F9320BB
MKWARIKVGYDAFYNERLKNQHEIQSKFESLDEFKTGFLKRFGNIWMTNKAEKERKNTKKITYNARNILE